MENMSEYSLSFALKSHLCLDAVSLVRLIIITTTTVISYYYSLLLLYYYSLLLLLLLHLLKLLKCIKSSLYASKIDVGNRVIEKLNELLKIMS